VVCISLDLNAATCRLCEGRLQVVWQKDESGRRNVDHNFCQCTACVDNNRQLRHRDLNTTTYIHRLLSTELAAKGRPACLHPQIRGNTGKHSWGKRPQTLVRIRIGRNENLGAYVFISGSVLSGTGVNARPPRGTSIPYTEAYKHVALGVLKSALPCLLETMLLRGILVPCIDHPSITKQVSW
jgi:hypothetical protein